MGTEGLAESFELGDAVQSDIILGEVPHEDTPIENIRSKVSLTRDAARAISITAFETLREGANSWA